MGKHINNNHPRNNKTQSDKSSQVKMLFKDHQPDQRNQDNPHPRPNGISNTHRNGFHHNTKAIKSTDIPHNSNNSGNQLRELLALLHKRSGYGFKHNRQKQNQITFHNIRNK